MTGRRSLPLFGMLCAAALVAALLSLAIGPARLSAGDVLSGLLGTGDETTVLIIRDIRLPRTVLALAIGAMLGMAGAALQALTRNPLAEPALFGAPQTAAFAAVKLSGP